MAKENPLYLGGGFSVPEGIPKHTSLLKSSKLAKESANHLLVLGSVSTQFALDLNEQLHKKLQRYSAKSRKPEALFHKAISSLKVPPTHEIVRIESELDYVSELRLKTTSGPQTLEEKKTVVSKAWIGYKPLELIYENRPNTLEDEYGWRNSSRQLDVLQMTENGFKARHSRGIRNYRWDKVERVAVLNGDANNLAPELCIELRILYDSGGLRWRRGFLVTEVHELLSDYKFGSIEDRVNHPSAANGLRRSWG